MMGGKVRCEKSVTTDVLGISTAGSSPVVSTVWDPQRQQKADTGEPRGMAHDDDKSGRTRGGAAALAWLRLGK